MGAVVTHDRWEIIGAVASTVSAIASIVAISFIAIQLRSSNRIAKAQLINELERDISLFADIYNLPVPLESNLCNISN
jgi:hypothetical protein